MKTEVKKKQRLRLFVWTNFESNYSGGIAFAIAKDEFEASKLVEKDRGYPPYLWGNLKTYPTNKKIAFSLSGGA